MSGISLSDYFVGLRLNEPMCFMTDQMHSDRVVVVDTTTPTDKVIEADSFVTSKKMVVCHVRTADCVPILMHDAKRGVVGAVHAGWKGTATGIVAKTVHVFEDRFGSRPEGITVAIGPCIGKNCFEVDEDVYKVLSRQAHHVTRRGDKYLFDLQSMNRNFLLEEGVKNIDVIDICTHCDSRFISYRRDRSEEGRQMNFIVRV